MNEMVERVARAILRTQHEKYGAEGEELDSAVNEYWPQFVERARAAIAAMREPTEPMIRTGDNHTNCGGSCGNKAGRAAWYSMIDAALKE